VPGDTLGGEDPSDGIVRIAVVQPAEAADTSAWDVGTAAFLPGLLPATVPAQPEEREEDFATDLVERTDEPWRPAEDPGDEPRRATYQRLRSGQGEVIPDELPTCGDGPAPEPEVAETDAPAADGEEAEEEERTMADLLSQDGTAWGGPASKPSGVLE
ncbi:MAG: hypothetical protein ACRD0H_29175, partial [Actinomycetes bacterium]